MKIKKENLDLDRLRRCKNSSPESKLEWLSSAFEFGRTKKKILKSAK